MLTPLGVVNLSVINLSSPTLRAWGLVSATFLEAPARFQPCRPLEPLESGFSQAGAKEPQDERGGTPPDGVPGSLWTSVPTLWKAKPQLDSLRDGPTH